jgi:methionine-rich copper-binding protein CopC
VTRTALVLASLFAGLAGVVLLAAPALAHASLVGVSPTDGSTLTSAVTKVTFTFDENIRSPSRIVVTGPQGQRSSHGSTEVLDNTVTVAVSMQPRSGDVGRYGVAYRVVSADGHVVTGRSTFQYRPPGVEAAPARAATSDAASSDSSHVGWFLGGGVVVLLLVLLLLVPLVRRGGPSR